MACSDSWSVVRWQHALLILTPVAWVIGIKTEPSDNNISTILNLHSSLKTCKNQYHPAEDFLISCKSAVCGCVFSLNYRSETKIKPNLRQIESLKTLSGKKKVWGDKTNRTTEAMEASPSYLMCTQSQIQYSQPFFSLSSESVRALSLMGCRGADGWMTGKMS